MYIGTDIYIPSYAEHRVDPYTLTDDVAEHFAGDDENNQRTAEEILASALTETPDEQLTGFALRIALTGSIAIPREGGIDLLAEAAAAFVPTKAAKGKVMKPKTPTLIKATSSEEDRLEKERSISRSGSQTTGSRFALEPKSRLRGGRQESSTPAPPRALPGRSKLATNSKDTLARGAGQETPK